MADQLLDVVNEADEVVGQALRSRIHADGLLHREVHVFFITPTGQVILQQRAAHKDWGDHLDATAGGHVEPGQDYLAAALMEVQEETGLTLTPADLIPLGKIRRTFSGSLHTVKNNVWRQVYGFVYKNSPQNLRVEKAAGAGFVEVALDYLQNPAASTPPSVPVVPSLLGAEYQSIYQALKQLA